MCVCERVCMRACVSVCVCVYVSLVRQTEATRASLECRPSTSLFNEGRLLDDDDDDELHNNSHDLEALRNDDINKALVKETPENVFSLSTCVGVLREIPPFFLICFVI